MKHNMAIRAYLLCDKAKPDRRHCSDVTTSRDVVIGSLKAGGECCTCTDGVVSKTVSLVLCLLSVAREQQID